MHPGRHHVVVLHQARGAGSPAHASAAEPAFRRVPRHIHNRRLWPAGDRSADSADKRGLGDPAEFDNAPLLLRGGLAEPPGHLVIVLGLQQVLQSPHSETVGLGRDVVRETNHGCRDGAAPLLDSRVEPGSSDFRKLDDASLLRRVGVMHPLEDEVVVFGLQHLPERLLSEVVAGREAACARDALDARHRKQHAKAAGTRQL
mmetsp:Transcript_99950/g.254263  ORF Transcript_99950/g.254263 Transcript_99950/m.254263 type:complete len:202 (+) Transcript_99950:534-1139(+)